MFKSLNTFRLLRGALVRAKWYYFVKVWGMDLHPTVDFSLSAHFDLTNPKGVHVGAESYVTFGATILAHDLTRTMFADTYVGRRCFISARSIIMPGVRVGDECIVAAGAVVTRDVPPRSVVAGNPARVIKSDIVVGPYGRLVRDRSTAESTAIG